MQRYIGCCVAFYIFFVLLAGLQAQGLSENYFSRIDTPPIEYPTDEFNSVRYLAETDHQRSPETSIANGSDSDIPFDGSDASDRVADERVDLYTAEDISFPPWATVASGRERFWFRGDYLMWWPRGYYVPPLVTASPVGTPVDQIGVLNQPDTSILYGDEYQHGALRSGFRMRAGFWFDRDRDHGIEGEWFMLDDASNPFYAETNGSYILGRPFDNALTGQPDAELIPSGSITAGSSSTLSGVGVRYLRRLWSCCDYDENRVLGIPIQRRQNLNLILGYRFFGMSSVPQRSRMSDQAIRIRDAVYTMDFETLTNSDNDNTTQETITVEYTAVVINNTNNVTGQNRNNQAAWSYTGGTASDTSANVTIVEPTLTVEKTVVPTTADANDLLTYTIIVTNTGSIDAYDIDLSDTIPTGVAYVAASLTNKWNRKRGRTDGRHRRLTQRPDI